jgi:ATP-dependent RNA helicase DDX49/DBP8
LIEVLFAGGLDMVTQSIMLGKKPHIIIATPGKLVELKKKEPSAILWGFHRKVAT